MADLTVNVRCMHFFDFCTHSSEQSCMVFKLVSIIFLQFKSRCLKVNKELDFDHHH